MPRHVARSLEWKQRFMPKAKYRRHYAEPLAKGNPTGNPGYRDSQVSHEERWLVPILIGLIHTQVAASEALRRFDDRRSPARHGRAFGGCEGKASALSPGGR